MKSAATSSERKQALEAQLADLTDRIRKHTGTNAQLARLQRSRLAISKALFDEQIAYRNELLKPAAILDKLRADSGVSKEADHALALAVVLFHSVSVDDMEYVNRRVERSF